MSRLRPPVCPPVKVTVEDNQTSLCPGQQRITGLRRRMMTRYKQFDEMSGLITQDRPLKTTDRDQKQSLECCETKQQPFLCDGREARRSFNVKKK